MDDQLTGIIKEICAAFPSSDICCIETGTIRDRDEASKSTLVISEALGSRGGLVSVDNSMESISISKEVCSNAANVIWELSDSVEYIKASDLYFYFAYLDSKNDAQHIFNEFKVIISRMTQTGIILIDNAGIMDDTTNAKKGKKVHKFLMEHKIPYVLLPSDHGGRLQINCTEKIIVDIMRGLGQL